MRMLLCLPATATASTVLMQAKFACARGAQRCAVLLAARHGCNCLLQFGTAVAGSPSSQRWLQTCISTAGHRSGCLGVNSNFQLATGCH
ncbi:hypothetical protein COO60DRAFT_1507403 [Scenedesmus sp. NREL 46B-D3]|nr:hypothetical protein COO60DRAFT_1507403 [Scenedesmus sp. NREL 46B-D3]